MWLCVQIAILQITTYKSHSNCLWWFHVTKCYDNTCIDTRMWKSSWDTCCWIIKSCYSTHSTIPRLCTSLQQIQPTWDWPQSGQQRVPTPRQDHHIAHTHLCDCINLLYAQHLRHHARCGHTTYSLFVLHHLVFINEWNSMTFVIGLFVVINPLTNNYIALIYQNICILSLVLF